MTGVLVLVGTPVGNLADLSPRAVTTLTEADLIACEDTRRTGRLLKSFGIDANRLLRVDAHTEERVADRIILDLEKGRMVAMVSDAGMPGISDPGERLVRRTLDAGYRVSVVPGPTSPVAALVVSGMPTGRWCMEGFLPRKGSARTARLAELAVEERTIVLFESARRLSGTLEDLVEFFGSNRAVVVVRELTKLHEEVWRGSLSQALQQYSEAPKGEVVLVVAGEAPASEPEDQRILAVLSEALASGASTREAAGEAARRLGVSRSRAYRLVLGE